MTKSKIKRPKKVLLMKRGDRLSVFINSESQIPPNWGSYDVVEATPMNLSEKSIYDLCLFEALKEQGDRTVSEGRDMTQVSRDAVALKARDGRARAEREMALRDCFFEGYLVARTA